MCAVGGDIGFRADTQGKDRDDAGCLACLN